MKRIVNRVWLLAGFSVALAVCSATPGVAQKPAQSPTPPVGDSDQGPIVTNIRVVRLPITVVDKKGRFVSGLRKSDFQVFEDKVPQEIETFADDLGDSLPLYVAVLMDTSPSTAGKLKFEQEAALNFVYTVARSRKDRVLFATFDDEINLRQDFTNRLDLLDKAVRSVAKTGKQTALYDAIWQFCDQKMRSVPGRRVLVVVTDGEDTYSRAVLQDAVEIAQRTETTIFAISTKAGFLGTVPGVDAGQVRDDRDQTLNRLAEDTGGAAFFIGDMLSLENSFKKVWTELHAQYLVTYKPSNDQYDGSYRRVDVKLTDGQLGDVKVRTKRGYKAVADSARPR
jgi:VWFA-related protein